MKQKKRNQKIQNWLLLILSLIPIFALLIGGYIVTKEFIQKSNENFGLSFQDMKELSEDDASIIITLNIQTIRDGKKIFIKYDIGNISVIEKNIVSEFCVDGAFVQTPQILSSEEGYLFEVEKPDYVFDELCFKPQVNSQNINISTPNLKQETLLNISDSGDERFFPFDKKSASSIFIWVDTKNSVDETFNVETKILLNFISSDWNEKIEVTPIPITVNEQSIQAYQVDLTLYRLVSTRFFTILLISMLLIVITFILFVKETITAVELSLAILLGLWGIQGVLIPIDIQTSTLIHLLIILLYTYLVAIISIRFLFMPILLKLRK